MPILSKLTYNYNICAVIQISQQTQYIYNMTNRERLQRLDPVDRYRFLKNTLKAYGDNNDGKSFVRKMLDSDGQYSLWGAFVLKSSKEGHDYWRERIKIMRA